MPGTGFKIENKSSSSPSFKIGYLTLSTGGQSAGHTKRGLAIWNAVQRQISTLSAEAKASLPTIEMFLIGTPDDATLWPDAEHLAQLEFQEQMVTDLTNRPAVEACKQGLKRLVGQVKPNILLIDQFFNWCKYIYEDAEIRPPLIYGLARYYKGAYKGIPQLALDKLFQLEPFVSDHYNKGISRMRRRNKYEKENTTPPPFKPGEPWDYGRIKADRMLLAPVVNLEPTNFLSREDARKGLIALGIPNNILLNDNNVASIMREAKVIVIAGSTNRKSQENQSATLEFNQWAEIKRKKLGIKYIGENNGEYIVLRLGLDSGLALTDFYKYLPGIDILLGAPGYNLFYEVRLARQLKKFRGEAFWKAMSDRTDQPWREHHAETLFGDDSLRWFPRGENGADYIARDILRKTGVQIP